MRGFSYPIPDRLLFRSETLFVGRFQCPPGSPGRQEENQISASLMVYPWTGVEITQADREPVVANPNHMVFHNRGTPYRRREVTGRGERSIFMGFSPEIWAELVSDADPGGHACPEHPFRFGDAPCASHDFIRHHALLRALESRGHDRLAIEEEALRLARRALTGMYAARGQRRRRRRDTADAHRDAVHEAKLFLTARLNRPPALEDVARHVHLSAYHLCRVFREQTGVSIHRYLTRLRLRTSLARLREHAPLAELARDLGFLIHAHFTGAFGREFGITPSRFRSAGATIDPDRLSQTSRILEG